MARKSDQKHWLKIGPGGINCPCCAPAPGKRRHMFRKARRNADKEAFKIEKAELLAISKESATLV